MMVRPEHFPAHSSALDDGAFQASQPVPALRADVQMMPADFGLPGQRRRFFLAILPTGEHMRLTERAYEIVNYLQHAPAGVSYERMASDLARQWGTSFDALALRHFVTHTLIPHGLIFPTSSPSPTRRSLLTLRVPFLRKQWVSGLTRGLTWLYQPILAVPLVLATLVLLALVSGQLLPSTTFASTETLILAYLLALLSALWHEIGHATACRRFGVPTGAIGMGLYLIYPAFYTDVMGAWRLSRMQRVIVDLGGVYFQSMTLLVFYGLFLLTGQSAYLLAVVLNTGAILFAFNPFLRFDGYWMLNDLLGLAALDRFLLTIAFALVKSIKEGLRHPRKARRMARDAFRSVVPQPFPAWMRVLLAFFLPGALIFWFWFLFALAQWAWRLLPAYPLWISQWIFFFAHHQWTALLPLLGPLITPWAILFGLSSALFRMSQTGYRLFQHREKPAMAEEEGKPEWLSPR